MRQRLFPICSLLVLVCLLGLPALAQSAQGRNVHSVTEWLNLANTLIEQGKPAKAMLIYGGIAARRPDFTPAQAGLQRSVEQIGSPRRAERFLRYALAEDPGHEPALLAAFQALDRLHPLRFSGGLNLLPSTNVDHVASEHLLITDFGIFVIKDGGQERSGVGLGFQLNADWVTQPQPGHRFRLRASLSGAWYDQAQLRHGTPSLSLRYEHLAGAAPWSLEVTLGKTVYGGTSADVTSDNISHALRFAKDWQLSHGDTLALQLGGDYQHYSEKPYLTGPRYTFALERRRPLGAQGRLSYAMTLERGLPQSDYNRYAGIGLQAGYERPVFGWLRGGVSAGAALRNYDAAFPIVGARRQDRILSIGLNVTLPHVRLFGQIPKLGCTATRTRSNIALYSSNSVDCNFALTLDF